MAALSPDYSKRDCSLPTGCKDLIDVLRLDLDRPDGPLRLKRKAGLGQLFHSYEPQVIRLGNAVTVNELATLLGCKPFQIITDLLDLTLLATPNQELSFEIAAKVAAKHGFVAKRMN